MYAPRPGRPTGFLLYRRQNTLMAQPFDPVARRTAGDAMPVADARRLRTEYRLGCVLRVAGRRAGVQQRLVAERRAHLDRSCGPAARGHQRGVARVAGRLPGARIDTGRVRRRPALGRVGPVVAGRRTLAVHIRAGPRLGLSAVVAGRPRVGLHHLRSGGFPEVRDPPAPCRQGRRRGCAAASQPDAVPVGLVARRPVPGVQRRGVPIWPCCRSRETIVRFRS